MNSVDELTTALTALHIPSTHVTVGVANLIASHKDLRTLLVNRRLPEHGWSDVQIQHVLYTMATLDTNNKRSGSSSSDDSGSSRWCGVGEREGRVYSALVSSRHFGLSHGVGRSGDIAEPQPKALGSTVLAKLTLCLVLDAVRRGSGLHPQTAAKSGILLPLCTGMSMALVLGTLRQLQDNHQTSANAAIKPYRNIVLWSRIDQKSCFKAIQSAGLECVVVPTRLAGDAVVTDLDAFQASLLTYGDRVLAVVTTTSCFAPRVPDQVDAVARLCAEQCVPHVINNAYGLQSSDTSKLLNRACAVGRVDAIVCSTDKNFMVPIGGAIVLSPDESLIQNVGKVYAGRASASPMLDLFITLCSMGLRGYQQLLTSRRILLPTFTERLKEVANKYGERVLECRTNCISFGVTLDGLVRPPRQDEDDVSYRTSVSRDVSSLGAMLFQRCVSGTRIVPRGTVQRMGGMEFCGFGSSHDAYPHAYLTAACAIGLTASEGDDFFTRLDQTLHEFQKRQRRRA